MKRIAWLIPVCALAMAGCTGGSGDSKSSSTTQTQVPESSTFKVALLTPGPISDAGWSAMAYDGVTQIKDKMGAEVNNQEAKDTQIKDAMRAYAQKGYNLIIGHGFEYNAPAIDVAKDFPNTVFISSSGAATADNVGAFRFKLEEGFYLAGMLAGLSTKTGTVAMIGGDDVPSIRSTFRAFRVGAETAKPGIKVIETFTGNGVDPAKAKLATLAAIDQGADFVIHQANAAASGVFAACKDKGVMAFGANSDQNSDPSGQVCASAVIVPGPAFLDIAEQVKNKTYRGSMVLKTMKDGAIGFVVNPIFQSKFSAEALTKVDEMRAKIAKGDFDVPMDKF